MFVELLIIIASVFFMMIPGYFSAKKSLLGEKSLRELSGVHINFIYPCLILSSLLNSFDYSELKALWYLPAVCFGIMFIGFLIGLIFIRLPFFSSEGEKKAFLFQCSINNYSFLPLPIAYCLYGEKGVALVIYSSIGAEIALWTFGAGSLRGFSLDREMLKKFFVPPLLALYFALSLIIISGHFSIDLKTFINSDKIFSRLMYSIEMLGSATVPIAMVVCGARLALTSLKGWNNLTLWIAIPLRLVLIPVIAIFAIHLLHIDAEYKDVLCIIAMMPVAVASILLSEMYGGDKDFIAASLLITYAFSLITVPLLFALLPYFGKLLN